MIEFEALPDLREPVLVAAFEGWNDAAEAASGVLDHLLEVYDGQLFAEVDPEDYYDFQVNRPSITIGEQGIRDLEWPGTRMYTVCPPDGPDLIVVRGVEPSMRWRSSCPRSSGWPSSSTSTTPSPWALSWQTPRTLGRCP
jgi:hypothetical protein